MRILAVCNKTVFAETIKEETTVNQALKRFIRNINYLELENILILVEFTEDNTKLRDLLKEKWVIVS